MLHHLTHLVGLQVAYKVPLDVTGQLLCFNRQFLGTALAEHTLSGIISLLQCLHRMKLGNGNEAHPLRKLRLNVFDIACYVHNHSFSAALSASVRLRSAENTSMRAVSVIEAISKSAMVSFIPSMNTVSALLNSLA